MNLSRVTRLKSRLVAGAGVASVLLVTSGAIAAPQLVLVNAKVFTADPALPYAQAVAIEDGRIVAVDSNEKVRPLIGLRHFSWLPLPPGSCSQPAARNSLVSSG